MDISSKIVYASSVTVPLEMGICKIKFNPDYLSKSQAVLSEQGSATKKTLDVIWHFEGLSASRQLKILTQHPDCLRLDIKGSPFTVHVYIDNTVLLKKKIRKHLDVLNVRLIVEESSCMDRYMKLIKRNRKEASQIFQNIILSSKKYPSNSIASANAVSIWVRMGYSLSGMDLTDVHFPRADLRTVMAEKAKFIDANLEEAQVDNGCFIGADFTRANFNGIRLGRQVGFRAEAKFQSIAFSADGRYCAVGNKTITIYDFRENKLHKIAADETKVFLKLLFSPDGEKLLSIDSENKVCLWECVEYRKLGQLSGFEGKADANTVCFSPQGKSLALATDKNAMYIWNVSDLSCLAKIENQPAIRYLLFPKEGVLASFSTHIQYFEFTNNSYEIKPSTRPNLPFLPNNYPPCFSEDGDYVALATLRIEGANNYNNYICTIRIFNVNEGKEIQKCEYIGKVTITNLQFTADLSLCFFTDLSGMVGLIETRTGRELKRLWDTDTPLAMQFISKAQLLAFYDNQRVIIRDNSLVKTSKEPDVDNILPSELSFVGDGASFFSFSPDLLISAFNQIARNLPDRVIQRDLLTGRVIRELSSDFSFFISEMSDGQFLVYNPGIPPLSKIYPPKFEIWDEQSQKSKEILISGKITPSAVQYSKDTQLLSVIGFERNAGKNLWSLTIYDAGLSQNALDLPISTGEARNIKAFFSSNSNYFALFNRDEDKVILWKINLKEKKLQKIEEFENCQGKIESNHLVLINKENWLSVYYLGDQPFKVINQPINKDNIDLGISSDGTLMVSKVPIDGFSCSPEPSLSCLYLWDIQARKEVAKIPLFRDRGNALRNKFIFSPDNQFLIMISKELEVPFAMTTWSLYNQDKQMDPLRQWTIPSSLQFNGSNRTDIKGISDQSQQIIEALDD